MPSADTPDSSLPVAIRRDLARYFAQEDASALTRACTGLRRGQTDMAALLDWIGRYPASREARDRAERQVRAALGLPVVGGPVCRR